MSTHKTRVVRHVTALSSPVSAAKLLAMCANRARRTSTATYVRAKLWIGWETQLCWLPQSKSGTCWIRTSDAELFRLPLYRLS
jgi:hypothetical protein